MRWTLFPFQYIKWHYSTAYTDMFRIVGNYLWFFWHFFSITLLVRTLFAPWKRLDEEKKKNAGFSLHDTFERFTVNTLMRIVGALIRIITIILGLITLTAAVIASIAAFILWTLLPAVIIFLIIHGLTLIL